jgi:hypothetical protein
MRICIYSIVFFLISSVVFSQIESETSDLIKTYENEINAYQSKLKIVDDVQFRTTVNRFENLRTSFQFRLLLNSYGVIKTKEAEIAVIKELSKSNLLLERNKVLKSHYEVIIKHYEIENQFHDINSNLVNAKKLDSLYEVYIKTYQEIDYKDYITNKQKLISLEQKQIHFAAVFDSLKKQVNPEGSMTLLSNINFKKLKAQIDEIRNSNLNNLNQNHQKLQIDLIQSNINHFTAKKNQIFENIIMSHNLREDLIVNDRFALGVTIKLPWFDATNKNAIHKLQFEKKMEEFKSEILNKNIDFELNKFCADFDLNYKNYQILLNHINNKSWTETYNLIVNSGKISIFDVIEFEKYRLTVQKDLNDTRVMLLKWYLEIIAMQGNVTAFKEIFEP